MQNFIEVLIGILVLLLGIPFGNYLAKFTKEELKSGQGWFKILIVLSLIGALISLIIGEDVLLFTFLFITIVTSRSLKRKKGKR